MEELGTLQRVDLRYIWATEAQDFTPWLAEENLDILASALELDLELEAQEQNVGPFRADILCKNTDDGSWVLIENQLERTDHTHLGQLLTYAAGLHAVTIVWIADRFTEEHRATLDWLNEITDDSFQFFGLEVELWKIGDSPPAPKFNVVSKPNDWARSVSKATRDIESRALTDTKALQLEYWTSFREYLSGHKTLKPRKIYPQHWLSFGIGRANFNLAGLLNSRENRISVELYLSDRNAKAYFGLLYEQREEIEQELGFDDLDWRGLPDRKHSRIVVHANNMDPSDKQAWPEYHLWMKEKLEKFDSVFRPRIKDLDADAWQPDEDDESD